MLIEKHKNTDSKRKKIIIFLFFLCFFILFLPYIVQNQIENGNFELGNIDFSTEYIYSPDDIWNEGTYAITTDPGNVHRLAVSFRDHTNSKGYMMVVNGSIKKQTYFWKKFVPVKPDTIYILSGWVAHWSIENPAHLCFYINNNPISEFIVPYGAGEWHNFSFIWNSGGNREALIEICDSNILAPGNDFVLDDLYFSRVFQ